MNLAFVDTSYYMAVLNSRERHHVQAKAAIREFTGNLVTSDYILMELGNALRFSSDRDTFISFWKAIFSDANTEIIPASYDLMLSGFNLFSSRPDKEWSLTDCISFSIMAEHKI